MTSETEHIHPLPIRKVRKTTRKKTSIQNVADMNLTDRILITKNTERKHPKRSAKIKVQPVLTTEGVQYVATTGHGAYAMKLDHKQRVRNFITTIWIAGICAFVLMDYYQTLQSLHRANIEISELKTLVSTTATTKISDATDPKEVILSAIRSKMEIPTDEDPAIILIDDAERAAREQAFYSQVIQGDIVVIYPKAKKAIIWSPSRMKIVNAGIVDVQQGPAGNADSATTTKKSQ